MEQWEADLDRHRRLSSWDGIDWKPQAERAPTPLAIADRLYEIASWIRTEEPPIGEAVSRVIKVLAIMVMP